METNTAILHLSFHLLRHAEPHDACLARSHPHHLIPSPPPCLSPSPPPTPLHLSLVMSPLHPSARRLVTLEQPPPPPCTSLGYHPPPWPPDTPSPRRCLPAQALHEPFPCRDVKLIRVLKLSRQLSQVTREGNLPGQSTRDPRPSTCYEKLSAP